MKKMNEEYFHVSDALGFDKGKSDLALEIAKLGLILRRTAKITKADRRRSSSPAFRSPKRSAGPAVGFVLAFDAGG